jgi:hypothetical protein
MISSVVVKKDTTNLNFTKVEVDITTSKLVTHLASYEFVDELRTHIMDKHRICLPCRITTDPNCDFMPCIATLYVPVIWGAEAIENYTQALMDELYLLKNKLPGHKTIKQIEHNFMLEIVVL